MWAHVPQEPSENFRSSFKAEKDAAAGFGECGEHGQQEQGRCSSAPPGSSRALCGEEGMPGQKSALPREEPAPLQCLPVNLRTTDGFLTPASPLLAWRQSGLSFVYRTLMDDLGSGRGREGGELPTVKVPSAKTSPLLANTNIPHHKDTSFLSVACKSAVCWKVELAATLD